VDLRVGPVVDRRLARVGEEADRRLRVGEDDVPEGASAESATSVK
jgi:hypothetical protein